MSVYPFYRGRYCTIWGHLQEQTCSECGGTIGRFEPHWHDTCWFNNVAAINPELETRHQDYHVHRECMKAYVSMQALATA